MYIVFPKFRAFRGFGVNNAEITKISSELFVPIPWANFCIPKNSENIDE